METQTQAIISAHMIPAYNPNLQDNRIPSDLELMELKKAATAHEILIESFKDAIILAETEHDAIVARDALLARQDQQIREIEGTKVQVEEAKKSLRLLYDYSRTLQTERNRLAGLTHPIRRCPTDILQGTFETTCELVNIWDRVSTSMSLSHVCRRWRSIALDTPRLWCKVAYSFEDIKKDDIEGFWGCLRPRMKAVGATIQLWDVEADDQDKMGACHLAEIPSIDSLTINLLFDTHIARLLPLKHQGKPGHIQSLSITSAPGNNMTAACLLEIVSLLEKYPSVSKLALHVTCLLRIVPSPRLECIKTLQLSDLMDVNVVEILSFSPQLKELHLTKVAISPPTTTAHAVSMSLQRLVIDTAKEDLWLPLISCPNLTTFYSMGDMLSAACTDFIQSHKSLLTLGCTRGKGLLPRLATIAPQLLSLSLELEAVQALFEWQDFDMKSPPFPRLEELGIVHCNKMTLDFFEYVVQERCLPANRSDNQLPPSFAPLKFLSLHSKLYTSENGLWQDSRYFNEARGYVESDPIWDRYFTRVLSWL